MEDRGQHLQTKYSQILWYCVVIKLVFITFENWSVCFIKYDISISLGSGYTCWVAAVVSCGLLTTASCVHHQYLHLPWSLFAALPTLLCIHVTVVSDHGLRTAYKTGLKKAERYQDNWMDSDQDRFQDNWQFSYKRKWSAGTQRCSGIVAKWQRSVVSL